MDRKIQKESNSIKHKKIMDELEYDFYHIEEMNIGILIIYSETTEQIYQITGINNYRWN